MPWAAAGFVTGLIHVVSGPDHLAAIAPLCADEPRRAHLLGGAWGLGHGLGILVAGGIVMLLRGLLPLEALSAFSERIVGVSLIGLGLWGFWRGRGRRSAMPASPHHVHASLGMGMVHGVAGSAHLLGALPALVLPTTAAAVGYLAAFALGSIAAMVGFSHALGRITERVQPGPQRAILTGTATFAIVTGCVWLTL